KDFHFGKEERASFEEVEPIFDGLYSRSQLWVLDHTGHYFRWKVYLSLITSVVLREDVINKQIEKQSSRKLGFEGSFDPQAFINCYQFAVILDRYANPYVKAVSQEGNFIN